jgi:hypothetical protein
VPVRDEMLDDDLRAGGMAHPFPHDAIKDPHRSRILTRCAPAAGDFSPSAAKLHQQRTSLYRLGFSG